MTREIKFRAWDFNLKEMIDVDDIQFYRGDDVEVNGIKLKPKPRSEHPTIINTRSAWRIADGQDVVLMQFTGLLDKNGKEIYEGDIVETSVNKKRWEVLQKDYSYMFATNHITQIPMWKNWTGGYFFWEFLQLLKKAKGEIEIIGNIYSNPELIK